MSMRKLAPVILGIALSSIAIFSAAQQSLAPYVPSPRRVIERMLELAQVRSKDVVYDLGCGDGRIVITATKKYGAHAGGVDIDPEQIKESQADAKAAGVEKLVTFKLEDAMKGEREKLEQSRSSARKQLDTLIQKLSLDKKL
jgi:cyclopropane fatty-acyl-phospholipid synthase-like methyltransferase